MNARMISETEITSTPRLFPDLREAWGYRRLALVLARRNIKARYMQTLLGSIWIVIQPLLMAGMFTLIFGILLSLPSEGVPYVLFAFTGTTIWTAFQRTLTDTSVSLAGSGNIILKVYFPRVIVPVSAVLTSLVDLIPIYALLMIVVAIYGQFPGWMIIVSPLFVLAAVLMAFAIGLWVTVLDSIFRDVRLVVPSLLQLLLYATPIMYSATLVPERWAFVFRVNPLLGLVNGFRWSTVASAPPPALADLAWSCGFTGAMLVGGLILFARLETFAVDRI